MHNGRVQMGKLSFKTRNNTSPQGKPRVYFACHEDDFDIYFEEITDTILKKQSFLFAYTLFIIFNFLSYQRKIILNHKSNISRNISI